MNHLRLLRPHQWVKNLFVLLPVLVAGASLVNVPWTQLALCVTAFCLASSSIYIVNDIFDAERDRAHVLKKNRPIADGSVSVAEGWAMSGVLMTCAGLLAHSASRATLGFVFAYILLNLIYSLWTKHTPLLDCGSIALGFCIRFLAGGVGFGIGINPILLCACFFGAFAMALLKRRIELSLLAQGVGPSRPSLKGLNLQVLDLLLCISGSSAMTLYAHWTLSSTKPLAIFTLPLLTIVISRIVLLAYLHKKGEDFSKTLLTDPQSLLFSLLFLLGIAAAVYS